MDESHQAVNDVVIDRTAWHSLSVQRASMTAHTLSDASYTLWNRWFKSTNVPKGSL